MINIFVRLIAVVALTFLVLTFVNSDQLNVVYESLINIKWYFWITLFLVSSIILVFLSLMFHQSIKIIDIHLPTMVSFNYTFMNSFFNIILPLQGGIWVRGIYLKKNYDLQWRKYVYVVITSQIINIVLLIFVMTCMVLYGAIPLSLIQFEFNFFQTKSYLLLLVLPFSIVIFRYKNFFSEQLSKIYMGIKLWCSTPTKFYIYLFYASLFHIFTAFRLWFAFFVSGESLSLPVIISIYVILTVGLSWAFTPGNIGVKEVATIFVASIFGIELGYALAASIVDRISSISVVILFGSIATFLSSQSKKS